MLAITKHYTCPKPKNLHKLVKRRCLATQVLAQAVMIDQLIQTADILSIMAIYTTIIICQALSEAPPLN